MIPLSNCSQGSVTLPGTEETSLHGMDWYPYQLCLVPSSGRQSDKSYTDFLCTAHFPSPENSAEGIKAAPHPSLPLQDPGCRQGKQENASMGSDTSTNCLNRKLFQPGDFKIITNIHYSLEVVFSQGHHDQCFA